MLKLSQDKSKWRQSFLDQNKKFQKYFHMFVFAYVYLMIALTIPTNFSVTAPNKTRIANTMINITDIQQSNHFRTVSVLTTNRITGFARMIYELNDAFLVSPLSYSESILTGEEANLRGNIQKQASFEQSLITAYTLAKNVKPEITINYQFSGMLVDFRSLSNPEVLIGDLIVDIDHLAFNDYELMGNYFIESNAPMTLSILRNGTLIDVLVTKNADSIFRFYPKYQIISANPSYTLPGNLILTSGPSAGMMYTLSIYFGLIEFEGLDEDIVGTGTIRYNNEVGNIGGLRQKVYTAIKEGINHFIIPSDQYQEVSDLGHLINIYPVVSIMEAIEVVYEISA